MQYVCLPSDRDRSYIFLSGLKTKMDFAMVYTVVSISHQASKRPLKQLKKKKRTYESTQDCGANRRLF